MPRSIFAYLTVLGLSSLSLSSAQASDCDTWNQLAPIPGPFLAYDMIEGNGVVVLVGGGGSILRSADGLSWSRVDSPTERTLHAITWTGTRFVAVGDPGMVLTSPDGLSWTQERGTGAYRGSTTDVEWDGSRLLALDSAGNVRSSADGVWWTTLTTLPAPADRLIFAGGLYLALGMNGSLQVSDNAIDWREIGGGAFGTAWLHSAAYGAGRWVVVGEGGGLYSSPDDLSAVATPTWTHHDLGLSAQLLDVRWQDTRFVAVGEGGSLLTSSDGSSWQVQDSNSSEALVASTLLGSELFVAGANNELLHSSDGLTWSSLVYAVTRGVLITGARANGRVVAIGGALIYSDDGVSWTEAPIPSWVGMRSIDHFAGQWVLGGGRSEVALSSDLVSWDGYSTQLPTLRFSEIKDLAHSPSLLVAISGQGLASSPDGVNWTVRASNFLTSVTWGGGTFVAVGYGTAGNPSASFTSSDGLTWTEHALPYLGTAHVTWGAGQFVVVGDGGMILTSADGATWLQRSSGVSDTLGDVGWDGARFIAVATDRGYVLTSPDARRWTRRDIAPAGLQGLATWEGGAYVLGSSGLILTSVFKAVCAKPVVPDLTEGASGVAVHVRLNQAPSAPVTVDLIADVQVTVSPTTLHFDTGNWRQAQTIVVQAVDDTLAEGEHVGRVQLGASSGDASYDGLAVSDLSLVVHDNDLAGLVITESAGSTDVNEAGDSDRYQVVLSTPPLAGVDLTVTGDGQVTASPALVHFASGTWNHGQTITVTAVDDHLIEGDHEGLISHSLSSADGAYDGLLVSGPWVHITDDDIGDVLAVPSGGLTEVTEGGATDSVDFLLSSEPRFDVTVILQARCASAPQFHIDGAQRVELSFTAQDWNTPQTVVVSAIDDDLTDGAEVCKINIGTRSGDADFVNVPTRWLDVTVLDDESLAGIRVEPVVPGPVPVLYEADGRDLAYDLRLNTRPSAEVTVELITDDQLRAQFTVTGTVTSLTISPNDFAFPLRFIFGRVNDRLVEGPHSGQVSLLTASLDPDYDGLTWQLTVQIEDDDPGVVVRAGSLEVVEGGATASYELLLSVAPSAEVTIALSSGSQISVSPAQLVFTASDFAARTITLSAVDDAVVEGPHGDTVHHVVASADPIYDGLVIDDLSVSIVDNDSPGSDAGISDAGEIDAAVSDAGGDDSARNDGGQRDASALADAGGGSDAGPEHDAGESSPGAPPATEEPGCGCRAGTSPAPLALLALVGLLARRRRRHPA